MSSTCLKLAKSINKCQQMWSMWNEWRETFCWMLSIIYLLPNSHLVPKQIGVSEINNFFTCFSSWWGTAQCLLWPGNWRDSAGWCTVYWWWEQTTGLQKSSNFSYLQQLWPFWWCWSEMWRYQNTTSLNNKLCFYNYKRVICILCLVTANKKALAIDMKCMYNAPCEIWSFCVNSKILKLLRFFFLVCLLLFVCLFVDIKYIIFLSFTII